MLTVLIAKEPGMHAHPLCHMHMTTTAHDPALTDILPLTLECPIRINTIIG